MTFDSNRILTNDSFKSRLFILTQFVFPVILSVKNWGYFGAANCHKNTIKKFRQ